MPDCTAERSLGVRRKPAVRARGGSMRAAVALTVAAGVASSIAAAPAWAQVPGWKRTDLRPVSQPAVVGDRVMLLVGAAGGLRVIALDAASGATVWSHDASPWEMAPGEAPYLAIIGGEVVFL